MTVNLHQSTKDLQDLARTVVANPTIFKKVRRSGHFSGFRRGVQSKEAAAAGIAGVFKKGVSLGFAQIPIPGVGSLLDRAWAVACDAIRAKHLQLHVDYPVNSAERVKFELKDLGKLVEGWDNDRWKVNHAVEQYNKAAQAASKEMETAPCDTWVRVWSKYYYLGSRIGKLRESIEGMRAILLEVDLWLDSVEAGYEENTRKLQNLYETDVAQLKTMQAHDTCSDVKCMFKQGSYKAQRSVPTSDAAKFFIKTTSTVVGALSDPAGDLIDGATS